MSANLGLFRYIWPKKPKMTLISEYLAADLSADASADALCIINIGYWVQYQSIIV